MAIAQHKTVSLSVNTLTVKSLNPRLFWQPLQLSAAWLKRFWWHGKAYGTIFGIMLLTLGSLVFLSVNWFYRKLLSVPDNQEQEWDTLSSK